jgi:hypothetical protein
MEPFSIVVAVDKPRHFSPQVLNIRIFSCSNLFPLERSEEAFTVGVITRVGGPADARNDAIFAQRRHVTGMEVLHAPIRVMHQPWPRLSVLQSIRQCRKWKSRAQSPIERPADYSARELVQHNC